MTLRALIWAAVSTRAQTEDDDKISLPLQESAARELAAQHGWRVVDVLRVPGHSRHYIDIHDAAADMRAQGIDAFDALMRHWEARDFDALIVRDGDRFARTQTLHAYVTERTIQIGARIYSLQDGWIDANNFRMWIAMGGYRAASDVDRLVKARNAAMDHYARQGLPTSSSVILSHRVVRDELGRALRLEVDDNLRRLWDDAATLVLEGIAWHKIERELYERFGHVNPNTGQPFGRSTLYHYFYHPTFWGHSARHFNGSKRGQKRGLWVFDPDVPAPPPVQIHYHTHEPVFAGAWAERIKSELRRRHGSKGTTRPAYTHRFARLLVCGTCGHNLNVLASGGQTSPDPDSRRYYRCVTRYQAQQGLRETTCTETKVIRELDVITWVDARLRQMIAEGDPEAFVPSSDNGPALSARERVDRLARETDELAATIRRLILQQASADPSLATFYQDAINQANSRLRILRGNLLDAQYQARSDNVAANQVAAYRDIAARSVDVFWEMSSTEINQLLHRLLGNRRLVVKGGKIVGTADAV